MQVMEKITKTFIGLAVGALSLFIICGKRLKGLAATTSELHMLEHLKYGVEHGQREHVALLQPTSVK